MSVTVRAPPGYSFFLLHKFKKRLNQNPITASGRSNIFFLQRLVKKDRVNTVDMILAVGGAERVEFLS